jgi:hypothetical protein
MAKRDFAQHNAEQAAVWQAFHEGRPTRVPMVLGINPRYTMWRPEANPRGIEFEPYTLDPDLMFERQLEHAYWINHHLVSDREMGVPESGWNVYVDFQNTYEAAWLGCEVVFRPGEVPDTVPRYRDDAGKWTIFDCGIPDPIHDGGWMSRAFEYLAHMRERAEGYEFHGKPVYANGVPGGGTDGPLTVACNVRGATEVLTDMLADPDYFHRLMDFITESIIVRIRAHRAHFGQAVESTAWGYADDSVQLLSLDQYKQYVLPYHKRLVDTFGPEGPNSIHLCGKVSHLLPFLKEALNITAFDTGFPIDLGQMRRILGPEVLLYGGPDVAFLSHATPEQVRERTREILQSGVMAGGRFVLREGNNLPPQVPPENVAAMYEACKAYGRYQGAAA